MTLSRAHRLFRPFCWLAWLSLFAPLAGQSVADEGVDRGLLFRVQAAGSGGPSWLFGTIHSEDARVLALPELVQQSLGRARAFAMEVVPDADAMAQSTAAMRYHDGQTLSDLLPAELYAESISALAERGLPEAVVRSFKPWAVMLLISMPEAKTGQFLDMKLYQQALSEGLPVVGLESMDEQLAVFERLSLADQVALLRETLAVRADLPDLFSALVDAYIARDLPALTALGNSYLHGADPAVAARFEQLLLHARNERMAERVLPLIERGGYFVAVGALHLPGPGGLLERLRAAGFDVERVY
jgi:uncharacterized protein YbaP (TraB family)